MNEDKTRENNPVGETAPASTEAAVPAKKKGFLRTAFTAAAEIGAGAAIMWSIKACTAAACASLVATPAIGIVTSALVVGALSPLVRYGIKLAMTSKKERANVEKLTLKKYFRQAAMSTAFGAVGAGLNYYFDDITAFVKDTFSSGNVPTVDKQTATGVITQPATPSVTEPQTLAASPTPATEAPAASAPPDTEAAAPAPEPTAPLTSLERMQELANNPDVSDKVKAVLERVDSPNKRVSAQAIKDLGYFAYNGLGGVPKDQSLAVELFKQAAEAGNMQAKIDLALMEFHGNPAAGVPRDVEGSLEKLEELAKKSRVADRILGDLVGPQAPIVEPHATFTPAAPPSPAEVPTPSVPAQSGVEEVIPVTSTPAAESAPVSGGLKDCIRQVYNGAVSYLCSLTTDKPVEVGQKFLVPRGSPMHPAMNLN